MTNKVAREFRAGDGSIELLLTEVITSETGTRLLSQLATLKGHDITLSIFSPGGDAHAAFAVHDYIKDEKNALSVDVRVYGIAASGAMIIAAAARKAYIGKGAFANIHNAFSLSQELSDNEKAVIASMNERQVDLFAARTGKRKDAIRKLMERDELLSADEAVAFGLFDATIEEAKIAALLKPTQMEDEKKFRAIKVSAADALKAIASGEVQVPEEQFTVTEADKVTALDAQIATLTAERDALKADKEAAEKKATEAEAAKVTEAEVVAKMGTDLKAAQDAVGKYQAALEALKKNPLVAQVMPDGTTVVIPGSTEDDGATPKSKRDQELETTANAFEQAKKDYIQ
ncbi:MAG: ATP-dependent Clp protease proteolytic subunit [Flavobacteriales bacterium]|nr:ATP-dependent Clp protease proteolytic subunit [Flavobacteriales bacterium]